MTDIRQSPEYARYIKFLGWQVEKLGKWNIFIKKFPLIGSLIKIQRIEPPIPFAEIETLAQKHHAFQIILEPSSSQSPQHPQNPQNPHSYRPLNSPFIPTKTLILDLKRTEQEIFNSFSKNKRRDIRIAERNNLLIGEGTPEQFIELKKIFLWKKHIIPFAAKREILPLWQAFAPDKAQILVAYLSQTPQIPQNPHTPQTPIPLAGLLLLFSDQTAYYWQAAATDKGKKLLAPTLLLWEAIKLAKKKGCTTFDFEGVYDERFPKNKSWLGFTKFKQGFGGKELEFPLPLSSSKFPLNIL